MRDAAQVSPGTTLLTRVASGLVSSTVVSSTGGSGTGVSGTGDAGDVRTSPQEDQP